MEIGICDITGNGNDNLKAISVLRHVQALFI